MKFSVLLTSLLFVSQMVFAQEKPTETLYQEAYDNFVKRDYAAASTALDQINPDDQKKPDVLNLRGAIYKRMGELDNAANAYSDALKINPKDWVPKYNLAEVNFLREQYKSSRTFLEQALASMPESDRLQKQDLILYKVYLTYLMQNDEEKAKLLLDSFDMNSANPVYYFAQAAWSYKKKDAAKAKTWVSSTEGLYSQDLRNSYGQALVDIGWMEPSAGLGAGAISASPAPTETPGTVVAAASPTPTGDMAATLVPLASDNATPIPMVQATAIPTPEAMATASPSATIAEPSVVEEPQSEVKSSPYKFWLSALAIVAIAGVVLIWLAKRSRIVPPAEDNTGYAAIAASASRNSAGGIGHTSEGTGAVLEQDFPGEAAPTPIKISPIQRDYSEPAHKSGTSESSSVVGTSPTKLTGRTKPSPKSVATSKDKMVAPTKKAPAVKKTVAVAPVAKAPATTVKKVVKEPARDIVKTPKKGTPAAAKPASPLLPATEGITPSSQTAVVPVVTESIETAAPIVKKASRKAAPKSLTTSTPATSAESSTPTAPKRARLVAIPTITVPPPEVPAPKLMVSNIEILKVDPTKEGIAPRKPAAKPKAPAKTAAAKPPKPATKTSVPKAASPLITIPEFEDNALDTTPAPVIRLVPEEAPAPENGPDKV